MKGSKLVLSALSACGLLVAGMARSADAPQPPAPPADLVGKVRAALDADRMLLARLITVSLDDKGRVVLKGKVFSDWDLREALKTANAAASPDRVVDQLEIDAATL
jgi:hypothetical protein